MRRTIDPYDPRNDAATRWPDWRIELTELHGVGELICPASKLILLDEICGDPLLAVAHGVAHLDLHLDGLEGAITPAQEEQADWLARVRLDRKPMGER